MMNTIVTFFGRKTGAIGLRYYITLKLAMPASFRKMSASDRSDAIRLAIDQAGYEHVSHITWCATGP